MSRRDIEKLGIRVEPPSKKKGLEVWFVPGKIGDGERPGNAEPEKEPLPESRDFWMRGRRVRVPFAQEFRQKIDHVEFHSPAGSLNIYRNGYLVHVPGKPFPHHNDLDPPSDRETPSAAKW